MIRLPATRKRPDGSLVFPRRLMDGRDAPEAVGLLRRILSQEKDGAVTIVQVGFSTNLARLLADAGGPRSGEAQSPPAGHDGRSVSRPVSRNTTSRPISRPRRNCLPNGPRRSSPAVSKWATRFCIPASSILNDFGYAPDHPLVDAWKAYHKMPYDRPTWDPTAVLYALRPASFSTSPPGTISVDAQGPHSFHSRSRREASLSGPHRRSGAARAASDDRARQPRAGSAHAA